MSWPAITLDQALELAVKSQIVPDFEDRINGDELEHARHAYAALHVVAAGFTALKGSLIVAEERNKLLAEINEELEKALTAKVAAKRSISGPQPLPEDPRWQEQRLFNPGEVTVEWRGDSGAYFGQMEAINHEIAHTFVDLVRTASEQPDEAVCAPFALEEGPDAGDST